MRDIEKVYRKVGRKYVECGYNNIPDISDGIWIVSSKPYSKGYSSVFWRVGDLKRPVDVVTHAALQTMSDDIARYMMNLCKEESEEYKDAKEVCGGYLHGVPSFYNISAGDMASLLLRRIATHLEKVENERND